MRRKIPILLLCAVGFISIFMPWVTYPKHGNSLFGYMGDGLIFAFLFMIISILAFLAFSKNRVRKVYFYIALPIAAFCAYFSYRKFVVFADEKENFDVDNPVVAAATAGFYLDYGVYVLAVASFSLLGYLVFIGVKDFISKSKSNPIEI